jgi:hypothetical protein
MGIDHHKGFGGCREYGVCPKKAGSLEIYPSRNILAILIVKN